MYVTRNNSSKARQMESLKTVKEKKLNCPERDLNSRSPAYMAGALTTKPPRQLSRLGTNPGIYTCLMYMYIGMQGNATN